MRSSSLLFGTVAAALLLTPVMAGAQPAPAERAAHHHELRGMFSPQQRAMLMHRARKQFREQTRDERHAFRREQVARLMAMSEPQRARLKADLQAEWDALPQARKARIEQRIAMREQHRHDRMEHGDTYRR